MSQPSRSFRIVSRQEHTALVEDLLEAQGFRFIQEPFSPLARRLTCEPFPLGSSLAARFGYIYIQDRSSMLPPLALAPDQGMSVLDMCASPGSKTGFLGQLAGPAGFILGNEPTRTRLATLRRNLQLLNLSGCCTTSYPGELLPLHDNSWDAVQLDPPCSGWGTVEKNPNVLDLWQGDKVKPLIAVQRRLLEKSFALLKPGGRVVYSTCTTNIEENEEQLRYATDGLGFRFVPLDPLPGFSYAAAALPEFNGALRIETGEDGQGFFVALLHKPGAAPSPSCNDGIADTHAPPMPYERQDDFVDTPCPGSPLLGKGRTTPNGGEGFFVRPWEKESRFVGERRRHGKSKSADRERRKPEMELIARETLADCFVDLDLLAPGEIAAFNGVAHFLPASSRELVPDALVWKAFPIGKVGKNGQFRLNQHMRFLMPSYEDAVARGLHALSLDDVESLLPLISGQGLPVRGNNPLSELGLYYKGLPLCRLSVKGNRAILPPFP